MNSIIETDSCRIDTNRKKAHSKANYVNQRVSRERERKSSKKQNQQNVQQQNIWKWQIEKHKSEYYSRLPFTSVHDDDDDDT